MIGNPIGYPIGGVISESTTNTGSLSVTLDAVTLVSAGVIPIVGQASVSLDSATLSASGVLEIRGVDGSVLDDVTLIASAHVAARVLAHIRTGGYAHAPGNDGRGLVRIRASGGRR